MEIKEHKFSSSGKMPYPTRDGIKKYNDDDTHKNCSLTIKYSLISVEHFVKCMYILV